MTLLCIELSAEPSVIGLWNDGESICEVVLSERNKFGSVIDSLFEDHAGIVSSITAIVVGIGPGSFTGLRIALSFAKGFALARSLPIWPLSSHLIIAANSKGFAEQISVISVARRGEVHLTHFDGNSLMEMTSRSQLSETELSQNLTPNTLLTGPAVRQLNADVRATLPCRIIADDYMLKPHTAVMAELASELWCDKISPDIHQLLPDYGMEFGITIKGRD